MTLNQSTKFQTQAKTFFNISKPCIKIMISTYQMNAIIISNSYLCSKVTIMIRLRLHCSPNAKLLDTPLAFNPKPFSSFSKAHLHNIHECAILCTLNWNESLRLHSQIALGTPFTLTCTLCVTRETFITHVCILNEVALSIWQSMTNRMRIALRLIVDW